MFAGGRGGIVMFRGSEPTGRNQKKALGPPPLATVPLCRSGSPSRLLLLHALQSRAAGTPLRRAASLAVDE